MIKSKTTQLIYQTIYCTLGIVGLVASIGIFDNINNLYYDFYVHFTNLSNFFCLGIMIASLVQTARKKEDSYVQVSPVIKFIGMLSILLTFLVFNILLAGAEGRDPQLNWRIGSLCFHVVLPIMYIADWFLFYERGKLKWYHPFASTIFSFVYVVLIFIQALILNFDSSILIKDTTTPLIYPYFFLNLEEQGVLGVLKWILLIFIGFIVVGYLFVGIDRLLKKKSKI